MDFFKKEINIDHKIVVLFVIFNFLIMGLYYSYSIFVIKQLKDNVSQIAVKTNVINMESTNLIDKQITVSAGTSSDITINLTKSITYNNLLYCLHKLLQ